MTPLFFIITHIILWSVFQLLELPRRIRLADRLPATFYFTSHIGNPIGFSFVVYAFAVISPSIEFSLPLITTASALAALAVYIIHANWQKTARGNIVTYYKSNGTPTVGGYVHLVYMWAIAMVSLLFLWHWIQSFAVDIYFYIFIGGWIFYLLMVVIDSKRNAI